MKLPCGSLSLLDTATLLKMLYVGRQTTAYEQIAMPLLAWLRRSSQYYYPQSCVV